MKSVMTTYPDFHGLPKEVKQLLLFSENYFFVEARSTDQRSTGNATPSVGKLELPNGFTLPAKTVETNTHRYLHPEMGFSLQFATLY